MDMTSVRGNRQRLQLQCPCESATGATRESGVVVSNAKETNTTLNGEAQFSTL